MHSKRQIILRFVKFFCEIRVDFHTTFNYNLLYESK